jgi:hypothetical protein
MGVIYKGWCTLGIEENGMPVRGERVAIGDSPELAAALLGSIYSHAGVRGEIVMRPMVGVALDLPPYADPLETARAIDGEQVTAAFLDFQGRCCVAVPAEEEHVAQTAHAVAKVVHILHEIHTPFINVQEEACEAPPALDSDAPYELAVDVLEAAAALVRELDAVPESTIAALRPMVAEGLHEVERAITRIDQA